MQNHFLEDIKQLSNEVEHNIENYQGRDLSKLSISCEYRIQYLFYYIFKSWKESNNQEQWIKKWRLQDSFFLFV